MSENPRDGVVNKHGQTHDIKNLFVSDGSQFTTGGAENPTLTIVTLAIRQADYHRRPDEVEHDLSDGLRKRPRGERRAAFPPFRPTLFRSPRRPASARRRRDGCRMSLALHRHSWRLEMRNVWGRELRREIARNRLGEKKIGSAVT